jgi:hypothetical protein
MERDRAEKGLAQVAGGGLAAVGSERSQRQEPEKGKVEDAEVAAEGRATAVNRNHE